MMMPTSTPSQNFRFSLLQGLLLGVFLSGLIYYVFFRDSTKPDNSSVFTHVIQNEIKHLSKLLVIEGSYSNVYSHQDVDQYLGDWISFEKKVLLVINAKAQIMYDLKHMDIEVDSLTKTIFINKIPPAEIQIVPDIKYYDIQQSSFNQFSKEEMNKIHEKALEEIRKMVTQSDLQKQADERLLEELSNLYLLSKSMGWIVKNNSDQALNFE